MCGFALCLVPRGAITSGARYQYALRSRWRGDSDSSRALTCQPIHEPLESPDCELSTSKKAPRRDRGSRLGDCPTQAEVEADQAGCPDTGCSFVTDTCGSVQVLTCACPLHSDSYYFDDSGALVAVLGYTDSPQYCSTDDTGSFWMWWGERPEGCSP